MNRPIVPRLLPGLTAASFAAVLPLPALAQDGRLDAADPGDTAWVLAASLVALLAVIPGLALFHAGRVRAGNAVSATLQVVAVAALVSLLWIVAGYTVAFGEVAGGWIGSGNAWMLIQLGNVRDGTGVPESAYALFQAGFALLAPALMTGAWAGRARFGWVLGFTGLWSLVVYAPVAHWLWGGGWLSAAVGTQDWAGGIVVHLTAGVSALVVAVMLGARRDRTRGPVLAHGPVLALAGAALIWLGALAQSGGYAMAASDDAAAAMISTHAAAASAGLVWLLLDRLRGGAPTLAGFATGVVAGLSTVSAAAGFVSPGAAVLLGALGALGCRPALSFVRDRLGIDDTLGVFAVHGIGGLVGAVLVAPFMAQALGGVGYGSGSNAVAQIVAQLIGVGVVVVWSAVATLILAVMTSVLFAMRVSEESERAGLDAAAHGERSWDLD